MNYGKSPQLWAAIENEEQRQQDTIELIASRILFQMLFVKPGQF